MFWIAQILSFVDIRGRTVALSGIHFPELEHLKPVVFMPWYHNYFCDLLEWVLWEIRLVSCPIHTHRDLTAAGHWVTVLLVAVGVPDADSLNFTGGLHNWS